MMLRRLLAGLLILGTTTPATAAPTPADPTQPVITRAGAIRAQLQNHDAVTGHGLRVPLQICQWYNWPNWPNYWRNYWPNY